MNRNRYFNYIKERLSDLCTQIQIGGKLNLLDGHGHSEDFYAQFLNLLLGWDLVNLNRNSPNVAAVDLIDESKKIVVQVSATGTKQKIENSISKSFLQQYTDYNFYFVFIGLDASNLRNKTFANPFELKFPNSNIYDLTSILKEIKSLDIDSQKKVYDFIRKELGSDSDIVKLDRNLTLIINILAKEEWKGIENISIVDSFKIDDKITYNKINRYQETIQEYSIYHSRIDSIYDEFDKLGNNKSESVLASIRREYLKLKGKEPDEIFMLMTESIKQKVLDSANFELIPSDELELNIDLLVVDAFIRCKVFENPKGDKNAPT